MTPPLARDPAEAVLPAPPPRRGLLARCRQVLVGPRERPHRASDAPHGPADPRSAAPAPAPPSHDPAVENDWARWARAVAGDSASADALVRELGRSGLRLAQQMLHSSEAAEDAVQEALLRLWRCPPQDRGTARLSTWFAAVVINLCRDALAQRRREASTDPELLAAWQDGAAPEAVSLAWAPEPAVDPGARLDALGTRRQLAEAVANLPPRQRMALALWAYADADVAEIARSLELEPNAAHQLLHRAKTTLRERLRRAAHDPGVSLP